MSSSISVPRTRLELAQPFDHYHLKVACIPISPLGQSSVVPPGFEPGLTAPKPAVLPLHNGTIIDSVIFDDANI